MPPRGHGRARRGIPATALALGTLGRRPIKPSAGLHPYSAAAWFVPHPNPVAATKGRVRGKKEGGERVERRRGGSGRGAPRSPGRRRHGAHPGAAGLLTVEGGAGGREETRGAAVPASPPRGYGRAPSATPSRRRRRPYIPCAAPVVAPCGAQEVLTAMDAFNTDHRLFGRMPEQWSVLLPLPRAEPPPFCFTVLPAVHRSSQAPR
jgi:hypothetical protein